MALALGMVEKMARHGKPELSGDMFGQLPDKMAGDKNMPLQKGKGLIRRSTPSAFQCRAARAALQFLYSLALWKGDIRL